MPKVPIITQRSVGPAPLPGFRESLRPESSLIQVGQGLKAIGQVVGSTWNAIAEEKEKADAARAVQELGSFTREADAVLLDPTIDEGTQKPKGYKLLQGEDAFGARDAYTQKIDDLLKVHTEALANDAQKKAFLAHANDKITTYRREIQAHAGNEAEKAQAQAYKIDREAELNHVASFADDPKARTTAISNLRLVALSEAARLGLPATDQQKWADLAEADATAAALNSLIARRNVKEAEALYAASKDKLGERGERIARQLEEVRTAGIVEQKASQIVSASLIPSTSWVAPAKALAAIDALPSTNPEEKAKVRQLVEHQVQKLEQLRDQTAERYFSYGLTVYNETGTLQSPAMAPIRAWLLDPVNGAANYWQRIVKVDDERKALGRTSSAEARRAQAEMNALVKAEYLAKTPGDQVRTDIPAKYAGRADQTTLFELQKVQNTAKKIVNGGGLATETEFQRFASKSAADAGLKKDVAADFSMHMLLWRDRYLQEHDGKEPTRKEMQEAVSDALLYGERSREEGFFQPNRFKFQAVERGEKFTPFGPTEQKFRGVVPIPSRPAARSGIRRMDPATGETRVWDEQSQTWVKEVP